MSSKQKAKFQLDRRAFLQRSTAAMAFLLVPFGFRSARSLIIGGWVISVEDSRKLELHRKDA
jgi:lipopolysaccharide export LptBFGC system permease protein LptF